MQSDVWGSVTDNGVHTLLVETLHKVQILLMVGFVTSFGHNLLRLFNHTDQHFLHMDSSS